MTPVRVLFLSANPSTTSRLSIDEELRAVTQRLRLSGAADRFDLRSEGAVRPDELPAALLRHRPRIVHISGHGSQSGELFLVGPSGEAAPVSAAALRSLFQVLSGDILCVVLNACFSETQAAAIAEVVPCAVGMTRAVSDSAAIAFAGGFYEALAFGQSLHTAFALGRTAMLLSDSAAAAEALELRARPEVALDRLFLFAESATPTPTATPTPNRTQPLPAAPEGKNPTRRSLRNLLGAVLVTRADFDRFCSDQFPAIWKRFATGMERVECETLLLSLAAPAKLLAGLREHDEAAVSQQAALLRYE